MATLRRVHGAFGYRILYCLQHIRNASGTGPPQVLLNRICSSIVDKNISYVNKHTDAVLNVQSPPLTTFNVPNLLSMYNDSKTETKTYLLQQYAKVDNCFSYVLSLFKELQEISDARHTELKLMMVLSLSEFEKEESLLNQEVKKMALETVLNLKERLLADLICDVYQLQKHNGELKCVAEELIKNRKLEKACNCIMILNLQNEFPLSEVIFPIIRRSMFGLIFRYLEGYPNLQIQLTKALDSCIGGHYSDPRNLNLTPKAAYKCLQTLTKIFDIPSDTYPNFLKVKAIERANFLLRRRKEIDSDEEWLQMTVATVKRSPEIISPLFNKLVNNNEKELAMRICDEASISSDDCANDIIDCNVNFSLDSLVSHETEDLGMCAYLTLELPFSYIKFIKDKEDYLDCLHNIKMHGHIIGIDAEWKPLFGRGRHRLSLMQIATQDQVYILDMISLDDVLHKEHWDALMDDIFSNPAVVKLGCGIMQDVQMLLDDFRGTNGKLLEFSHLLDVAILYQQLEKLYEKNPLQSAAQSYNLKGLSKLCQIILGKPLNKQERMCDWEQRPLTESQLTYAALDAYCLLQMFQSLQKQAEKSGEDFQLMWNQALKTTAGMAKSCVKIKRGIKLIYKSPYKFCFKPSINVQEFKVLIHHTLHKLGLKLRMYGANVVILNATQSDEDGVKVANDDDRIFFISSIQYEKIKKVLPVEKCFVIEQHNAQDETSIAQIFKEFNVRMDTEAIYSRCMKCNSNTFVHIPSDVLTEVRKVTMKRSDTSMCNVEPNTLLPSELFNADGSLINNVQIRFDELPSNILLSTTMQIFKVCTECGSIHYNKL